MSIRIHDAIPFHSVPRIKTRVLAARDSGTRESTIWEQWIEPDGFIPLHYHEVEEILVFLEGAVSLTMADTVSIVETPATVIIPARTTHAVKPVENTRVHLLAFFPTDAPTILAPDGSQRPMPWNDQAPLE